MRSTRLVLLLTASVAACAPDPEPRATALDRAAAATWTAHTRQGLSDPTVEPLGALTGYVTQTIEGVAAPVAVMQAECPERLLDAQAVPLYGLEAPYPVKRLLFAKDGLADVPMADYTAAATTPYAGPYVLVSLGDALVSVFPDGVATTTDAAGKAVPAAKVLRTFSLSAGRSAWGVTDPSGRSWRGTRVTANARFPARATEAVTEALQQWEGAPCR